MYTIKQAAALSGVGVSLLRAWERRYGVVGPQRSTGGYRLYDDEDIERLRAMRLLVDDGWAASQAAAAVLAEPDAARMARAVRGGRGAGAATAEDVASLTDAHAMVRAAETYDSMAVEAVLDALFARGSFEAVIDDLVLPSVAELGSAWASGRIDVAAEHLASAAVQRRLASLFDLAGASRPGRSVVVGLPRGCRHEIGTIAFAVALRRRGVNVLYLGPDVPTASWVHVTSGGIAGAVIGVTQEADVPAAREVVDSLQAERPNIFIALGGPCAGLITEPLVHVVGPRIGQAAVEVAELASRAFFR
ncbi:MAG: MerR family transcriptional regulator [Chloroflexota bacterium]